MILIKSEMDWCVPATSVSAPPDDKVTLARNRFKNVMRAQASRLLGSSETSQPCDCTMCNLGLACEKENKDNECFGGARRCNNQGLLRPKGKSTFYMKLFDRTMDVTLFQQTTTLYSLGREWMKNSLRKNQGGGKQKIDVESLKTENEDEMCRIDNQSANVKLPPPKPKVPRYDKYGNKLTATPRVGLSFLQQQDRNSRREIVDLYLYEDNYLPPPAVLFQEHLDRWAEVRQNAKDAIIKNEARYKASFDILREFYTS